MIGIITSIIAGAAMSLQGVFNTRLSEKAGLFESNAFVQTVACVLSIIVMLIFGKGNIKAIAEVNKLYLLGGVLGIIITVTVMLGIKDLSPVFSIAIILISQLTVAAVIDAFGLFETEKIPFGLTKYIGIALMIAGVVVFKIK